MRRFGKFFSIVALVLWDIVSVLAAVYISFRFKFGFEPGAIFQTYENHMPVFMAIYVATVVFLNIIFGGYTSVLKRFSIGDTVNLVFVTGFTAVANLIMDRAIINPQSSISVEILIMINVMIFLLMFAGRSSVRLFYEARLKLKAYINPKEKEQILIYGAGEAGTNLLKKITSNDLPYKVVGFVDDNKSLHGLKINGIPVLGNSIDLENMVARNDVKTIVVAIPTADHLFIKELLIRATAAGCGLRRYGALDDITDTDFEKAPITEINPEDLLRRSGVKLNMHSVKEFIKDKTVLVTGGVGSIGSEICRQALEFGCKQLLIFDINENGLFDINNELLKKYDPQRYRLLLGSIRDKVRIEEIFSTYKPDIVFHAAAHKHVPMMELNPKEAVKNNVMGTRNVAQAALVHKSEKFILISTDKAVNPTNIMGASKRIAEIAIQTMNGFSTDTEFSAVRFGNVLGSNGSVVPFFKAQIAAGGPVTVTHPEMRRYFMTIPEAVSLVLEAGAMAAGGEIFVLDMGEPVYISDLAKDMIRLSGFVPGKDIQIIYTGLRPGEKLFEEISLAEEDTTRTTNNKIFINKPIYTDPYIFSVAIKNLEEDIYKESLISVFDVIKRLVPTFNHEEPED